MGQMEWEIDPEVISIRKRLSLRESTWFKGIEPDTSLSASAVLSQFGFMEEKSEVENATIVWRNDMDVKVKPDFEFGMITSVYFVNKRNTFYTVFRWNETGREGRDLLIPAELAGIVPANVVKAADGLAIKR